MSVKIAQPEEPVLAAIIKQYHRKRPADGQDLFVEAAKDSWKRLIGPAIEREIRNSLTEQGEAQAIKVFAANLHSLLLQAPGQRPHRIGRGPWFPHRM